MTTIVALTGLVGTVRAGESPYVLSDEEMSNIVGAYWYRIKPGDYLIKIAAQERAKGKTHASWQEIYRINRPPLGSDPDSIPKGIDIWIPPIPSNFKPI